MRDLVEPVLRAALPMAELTRLTGALAHALHNVFILAAGISVVALLIILLVPRQARMPQDS